MNLEYLEKMKAKTSKKHERKGVELPAPIFVEASVNILSYIDSLLNMAEITDAEYRIYKVRTKSLTEGEAEELINELLGKQRNPILGGYNYQQRDIINMLKKLK